MKFYAFCCKKYIFLYHIFLIYLFSFAPLSAVPSNKTFFSSRADGFFLPLENSFWISKECSSIHKHGGFFSYSPYLSVSRYGAVMGKYFMFDEKNSLHIAPGGDVDIRHLKFNETSQTQSTIEMVPSIQKYGVRLDYTQQLDMFIPGVTLRASAPFICVKTDPGLKIISSSEDSSTIRDYFSGKTMWEIIQSDNDSIVLQRPLEYGKIEGTNSKSFYGNVDVGIEYLLFNRPSYACALGAHLIIPMSSSPTSEWLLEPLLGTAGHWGIGLSANANCELHPSLMMCSDIRFNYLIPEVEERILGLKDTQGNTLSWPHYMLVGRVNYPFVEPAANILAQAVRVYPGSNVEGCFYFSYNKGPFIMEGGYNIFARQKETVKRRSWFDDEAYAFVGKNFAEDFVSIDMGDITTHDFTLDYANDTNTISCLKSASSLSEHQTTIKTSQLDVDAAQTPALVTHAFFATAGIRYDMKKWGWSLGIGTALECPHNDVGFQNISTWIKASCMF